MPFFEENQNTRSNEHDMMFSLNLARQVREYYQALGLPYPPSNPPIPTQETQWFGSIPGPSGLVQPTQMSSLSSTSSLLSCAVPQTGLKRKRVGHSKPMPVAHDLDVSTGNFFLEPAQIFRDEEEGVDVNLRRRKQMRLEQPVTNAQIVSISQLHTLPTCSYGIEHPQHPMSPFSSALSTQTSASRSGTFHAKVPSPPQDAPGNSTLRDNSSTIPSAKHTRPSRSVASELEVTNEVSGNASNRRRKPRAVAPSACSSAGTPVPDPQSPTTIRKLLFPETSPQSHPPSFSSHSTPPSSTGISNLPKDAREIVARTPPSTRRPLPCLIASPVFPGNPKYELDPYSDPALATLPLPVFDAEFRPQPPMSSDEFLSLLLEIIGVTATDYVSIDEDEIIERVVS